MKIYIASDHAGVDLKSSLISYLSDHDYAVIDMGPNDKTVSVNYPHYAQRVCDALFANPCDFGILICGTGIGMSIAANRHRFIRAALCQTATESTLAREHNNANVLCLGARIITENTAKACVAAFLSTSFANGRHQDRLDIIS